MKLVVHGARLSCGSGTSFASLMVLSSVTTQASEKPVATINDMKPVVNIPPFGMCQTLANPEVASATATALGVLTPVPCVPVVNAPWSPGSAKSSIGEVPVLADTSTCCCAWAGVIQVEDPGSAIEVE